MEDNKEYTNYDEVLDSEFDDIWDIFFPYMADKKDKIIKLDESEIAKPRRHLKFLTMMF